MIKCPHCEKDTGETRSSNAERFVTIQVPEHHFHLFSKTISEMSNKLGMYGHGSLANELLKYRSLFNDNIEVFRFFRDDALTMAMLGVHNGHDARVVLGVARDPYGLCEEKRQDVSIIFTMDEGKPVEILVSDCAPLTAAADFKTYFEDYCARKRMLRDR